MPEKSIAFARVISAVLFAALAVTPAAAADTAGVSVTELTGGRCRFVADDGEVGDYALKRCPGLNGASVYTEAGPARVSLSLAWGKRRSDDVVAGFSLGNRLEWRGTKQGGQLDPHAALLRLIVRNDRIEDDGTFKAYNMLAVLRMRGRQACLMAVVDEAENSDALSLARRTADGEARSFICGKHRPKIIGQPSRWARKALGEPSE